MILVVVTVGISDLNVVKGSDIIVTYALGSCVGICLYDPVNKVAGLSHIMLPTAEGSAANQMKFADTAIPLLMKKMISSGAKSTYIKAKIAGGAQMFAGDPNSPVSNIGTRNVQAVKQALMKQRIQIVAEDTGKNYGRTVFFSAGNGIMKVKSALHGDKFF